MLSINFFLIFVPILSIILIAVNFILAPHLPYKEKKTPFECGYHSFLLQNRTQFTISFFIFGLLFLLFDLEIVLLYPFTVSSHANMMYGLIIMVLFAIIVTVGFVFELGKNALKIDSRQYSLWTYVSQPEDKIIYSKQSSTEVIFFTVNEGMILYKSKTNIITKNHK